jgi:hypothetical protein
MRKTVLLLLPWIVACERSNPEENAVSSPAPPPSAALAPIRGQVRLDQTLAQLESQLTAAIRGDGEFTEHLTNAEAITDRLLETQLPFAWITSRAYGVESKLRQIQSLADRLLAQLRSGVREEVVRRDARDMFQRVRDLRTALRAGGGPPPLSLDSLLAAYAADSLLQIIELGGE